ncbi:MAG: sulfatase-like hydrolase/transferase, partial [Woeseia sp.]
MTFRHCTRIKAEYSRTFYAILAFAVLVCASGVASAQARPNILFVLTDDLGWGDLRAYNPTSPLDTPTIEQLAADGMVFSDAHTSAAKCAPSRYSIITGNYQWRGRKGWGQWNYKGGSQILPGQLTLGNLLQQAGYRTAFVGKHNLGGSFYLKNSNSFASASAPDEDVDFARQFVDGPLGSGFDYSFLALRGIQASPYAFFEDDRLDGNANALIHWTEGNYGDTQISQDGIGLPNWNTREVGPTLLEKAVEFIDTHHETNIASGTNQPFFLYYNTPAAHSPYKPPLFLRDTPILGTSGISLRTDLIREIDEALRIIQTELDSRGLLDDTLIIFTSDNGAVRTNAEANLGHDALGGLRGDKGQIFEGGHRVPLIVKWGDGTNNGSMIQPGVVSDVLIGVQDMYATLANLTGIEVTEDQGRDSFNMLPILLGQSSVPIRDHMIHESDEDEANPDGPRQFAFRDGDWKLIFNGDDSPRHLFNLAVDPQETNDLVDAPSQSTRLNQMRSRFTMLRNSDRSAPLNPGELVQVPDVSGLTQTNAENLIDSAGLNRGVVSTSPSSTVGVGRVISQSPAAGTAVLSGTLVDLVVSSGSAGGENSPPAVTVTAPDNNETFEVGDPVQLAGTATDAEDGNLTSSINWSSSRDGLLGSGGSVVVDTLTPGSHTITATVTDSALAPGSTSVTISIIDPDGGENSPPVVNVASPDNNDTFEVGDPVQLAGTATDAEDG